MMRRVALSAAQRTFALRACLALAGASIATDAFTQTVTQSLTVNFTAISPVPIGGWAAIGIALLLAAGAGLALRKSSSTGTWIWFAALIGAAGLLALQPIRDVQAAIPTTPLNLVTNPAVVVFTFPGAPDPTVVLVTNASGATTTITAITLNAGPLGMTTSTNPCAVGTVLAVNATCTIGLSS